MIQILDTNTGEKSNAVATQFLDVASARQRIIDLALMSKQFPFKLEETFMAKWCSNDVETYAAFNIVYIGRGNERIHYHIIKVTVPDDTLDENKAINEAYLDVVQRGSADPFNVFKKKE